MDAFQLMIPPIFILLFALLSWIPRADAEAKPLVIAAAADLKFALDEVISDFRKLHPQQDAKVTYGSSGLLFAQIENGAPYDLFFSADVKFPRQLVARGKSLDTTPLIYAEGRLVLWVAEDSKLDIGRRGLDALRDARKIAIANPDHAPYGAAAVAALKRHGVYDALRERLVLGENIAQAAQFTQAGAADVGMIALSFALSPQMQRTGRYWEIPAGSFPRLEQGMIILRRTGNVEGAKALRNYLATEPARDVLKRWGFILPKGMK